MTLAIDAASIAKRFRSTEVLDDLDLAVETGSVFALLGPNGAAMTTTINILTTLVRPDAGTAVVAGADVLADPDGRARPHQPHRQSAAVDEVLTGRRTS
jgi:ABC-type multidrug transport system ATPase subunit